MPKIQTSFINSSLFMLNGLDYGRNQYQLVYSNVQQISGVIDESTIEVGLFSRYEQKYLVQPTPVNTWTDSTDAPYASLTALITALEEIVGFDAGGQYVLVNRVNMGPQVTADDGGLNWAAEASEADWTLNGAPTLSTNNDVITLHSSIPSYISQSVGQLLSNQYRWTTTWGVNYTGENGSYRLRMYIADKFWTLPNQRVWDITINGVLVADNFDAVAAFGPDVLGMLEFDIVVTTGTIDIDIASSVNGGLISAMELYKK